MLCEIDLVYYSMLQIARPQTLCVICKSAVIRITVEPFSDNSTSNNICTLVVSQSRGFFFANMVASVNKIFVELVFRRGTHHPFHGHFLKNIANIRIWGYSPSPPTPLQTPLNSFGSFCKVEEKKMTKLNSNPD